MITVVVGKRRNTTPWFSAFCGKNRANHNRKLNELRTQTARTATANCTNSDRKPHEPRPNRSVNLSLGSTVQDR